ncbi:uncharacterized protein MYCFIDRAFT_90510 [Pseudocercospora fijiensis CIRAD86]|uniref:Uncharacterized protein n=1 Tax=Pseudocercospora fijiensis (strain CIRAD86) TaxID=383855 RepID=M3B6T2_PSEFD|nr:uncharacterized protein MYCFIDRAFT_90510 [Pseudocercospora fijiensis CIRAD86]EME85052.1 hypothetical protein MYCFIDRAFT_90510 [Pseudocercospora fijiensis CIRAD86]
MLPVVKPTCAGGFGHYTYECTAAQQERPYVSRPSRSQQLSNPKLAPKLSATLPPAETKLAAKSESKIANVQGARLSTLLNGSVEGLFQLTLPTLSLRSLLVILRPDPVRRLQGETLTVPTDHKGESGELIVGSQFLMTHLNLALKVAREATHHNAITRLAVIARVMFSLHGRVGVAALLAETLIKALEGGHVLALRTEVRLLLIQDLQYQQVRHGRLESEVSVHILSASQ